MPGTPWSESLIDLPDMLTEVVGAHLDPDPGEGVEHVHDDVVLVFGDELAGQSSAGLSRIFEGAGRRARIVPQNIGQCEYERPGF